MKRVRPPLLVPGDLFIMKWSVDPPTLYLTLEDITEPKHHGSTHHLNTDVHQELYCFPSDQPHPEIIVLYESDFEEDGVLRLIHRHQSSPF